MDEQTNWAFERNDVNLDSGLLATEKTEKKLTKLCQFIGIHG